MNGEIIEEPFRSASSKVEEAHQQSVADLRAKVAKAKSEALKNVRS